MSKFRVTLILLALACLLLNPSSAKAQDWSIDQFNSKAIIQEDGRVEFVEEISVTFGADKHGIFRYIPITYQSDNGNIYTEITVHRVERNGQSEPYKIKQDSENLEIKIGDKDVEIAGKQTYRIHYEALGILQSFDGYDELYWNTTGSGWEVPIQKVSASVILPEPGIIQSACYAGANILATTCTPDLESPTTVNFEAQYPIYPGEDFTYAIGFESGMVPIITVEPPPTPIDLLMHQTQHPLAIPGMIASGLIGILLPWWLWYRRGRDWWWQQPGILADNQTAKLTPLNHRPQVVVEFTPPLNLRPAQVGKLIDQKADTLDITATIVDLASRGYLTITELEKKWKWGNRDYLLSRTDKPLGDLRKYEHLLMDKLFGRKTEVKISQLRNSFYQKLEQVKEALRQDIAEGDYFVSNPKKVRQRYLIAGIILLLLGVGIGVLGALAIQLWPMILGGGMILTGLGLAIVSSFMPQRTAKGHEAYRRILGYKLFISTAEKHKQQFLENKNIYTEILPYAMVFGLTKKLAKSMEQLGIQPAHPEWYHSPRGFNAMLFSSNMQAMSQSLSSAMASAPSSSGSGGGGYSGGGFGGGGGGSW